MRNNNQSLDEQLKNALKNVRFLKESSYLISIEIENPLLIDHLKSKLKEKGYITDGSFSLDIIKLNADAFITLLEIYLDEKVKKEIEGKLIDLGYIEDKSFKGILKNLLINISKKIVGNISDTIVSEFIAYLVEGSISNLDRMIKNIRELIQKGQKDNNT